MCVGIMITASHNAECDNGIKIVDYDGGMLHQNLEPSAVKLANAMNYDEFAIELKNFEHFILEISNISEHNSEHLSEGKQGGVVMVGWDTRPHSPALADAVRDGITACGGIVLELGEVTTPQLHYAVQDLNNEKWTTAGEFVATVALERYYATLINGFVGLVDTCMDVDGEGLNKIKQLNIVVDTAFGVGCVALQSLQKVLEEKGAPISIDLRNLAREGHVNDTCGAEFVQKGQVSPGRG